MLGSLPETTFEVKYYCEPKLANNNHIYIGRDKLYYSVPFIHIGSLVKVIYTHSMIYIYVRGKQVAVHIRSYQAAGYTTVKEHRNSHHRHYMDRSPAYYIEKAKEKSPELHLLVQLLFEQPRHPEKLYRTCDGLLRLEKKAPAAAFAKACELAIEYRNFSYHFVGRILQNNTEDHKDPPAKEQSLPIHANIRGKNIIHKLVSNFKIEY